MEADVLARTLGMSVSKIGTTLSLMQLKGFIKQEGINIMLIKIPSAANLGLETIKVDVEVNLANRGLPGFEIVGLPDKAVDESKERVRAAISSSGIEFPAKKITVNLAPADIPKEGSFYDLPIALGILRGIFQFDIPEESLFFGELSLDGSLRHTKGAFLLALFAKEKDLKIYLFRRIRQTKQRW